MGINIDVLSAFIVESDDNFNAVLNALESSLTDDALKAEFAELKSKGIFSLVREESPWDDLMTYSMELWEGSLEAALPLYVASQEAKGVAVSKDGPSTVQTYFVHDLDDDENPVKKVFRFYSKQGAIKKLWTQNQLEKLEKVASVFKGRGHDVEVYNVKTIGDQLSGSMSALQAYFANMETIISTEILHTPEDTSKTKKDNAKAEA